MDFALLFSQPPTVYLLIWLNDYWITKLRRGKSWGKSITCNFCQLNISGSFKNTLIHFKNAHKMYSFYVFIYTIYIIKHTTKLYFKTSRLIFPYPILMPINLYNNYILLFFLQLFYNCKIFLLEQFINANLYFFNWLFLSNIFLIGAFKHIFFPLISQ